MRNADSPVALRPSPGLRADFSWSLAGGALYAFAQWLLLIAMARWGSPRMVGEWALALSVTAPVFIFAQFKLRFVQAAEVADEYPWQSYVALRARSMLLSLAAVVLIAAVFYRDTVGTVIILIGVGKAFEGICDLIYGRQQRALLMRGITVALVRRAILVLAAGTIAVWYSRSAVWTSAAVMAAQALGLFLDWRLAPFPMHAAWMWSLAPDKRIAALARRTLPLGVATALGSLQVNVPRLVLDSAVSREAVGSFSLLAYPFLLGGLVITSLCNIALPRLTRRAASGEWRVFRRSVLLLCIAGAALWAAGVLTTALLGDAVLRLLYPPAYSAFTTELRWMSVAVGFSWCFVFIGTALDAVREYRPQPWIFGASTLVIASSCVLLVPRYGLLGAIWGMLAGYGVEAGLLLLTLAIVLRHTTANGVTPVGGRHAAEVR